MSRTLPTTVVQQLCSPEWISKTYSEYMLDCANSQFNLINEITEAIADATLDEIVNNGNDHVIEVQQSLVDYANELFFDAHAQKPFTNIYDDNTLTYLQEMCVFLSVRSTLATLMLHFTDGTSGLDKLQIIAEIDGISQQTKTVKEVLDTLTNSFIITKLDDYKLRVSTLIDTAAQNLNMSINSQIIIDDGCATLQNVIKAAINDSQSLDLYSFQLNTIDGTAIENSYSINADDLFEQLKSTASSAIAWGFGFASMAYDTMSDKLSYFEAQVKSFISDATESFASSVNVVRSRIAEAQNEVINFFQMAADELGWTALANDDLDTPAETDVFAYTGASPLGAIDTSCLAGIGAAVAKTALAIGAGIFEGAKALLSKAWKKVEPYVRAITDDPVDIGICNEDDKSYTCSTWMFHAENVTAYCSQVNDAYDPFDPDESLEHIMAGKIGRWISLDTFFCEIQIKINSIDSNYHDDTRIDYDYRMKPKCLNYRAMIKRGLVTLTAPTGTPRYGDKCLVSLWDIDGDNLSSLKAWGDFATSGEMYPENDEDEAYIYMGFVMSLGMMKELMKVTLLQVYDWYPFSQYTAITWNPGAIQYTTLQGTLESIIPYHETRFRYYTRTMVADTDDYWVPADVSNLDFLKIVSGYYYSNGENTFKRFAHNSDSLYAEIGNTTYSTTDLAATCMVFTFIMQQVDRYYYPSDYLYLPYYNNSYELSAGRYKIKTDADNADIANVIVNAIIIIAIVITVIVLSKTILKLRKRRKMAKLTQRVGELDNKMWNGHKMTFSERSRYFRAKNKLAKLESASSGLAGSGSIAGKIFKAVGQVQSYVVSQSTDTAQNSETSLGVNNQIYNAITGK